MEKQKSKNIHKNKLKTRLQNLNLFEIIIDYFTKKILAMTNTIKQT